MRVLEISPEVEGAVQRFTVPEQLGFGPVVAPVMYSAEWTDGAWGRGRLGPYGPIEIWPGSRALHYAELVFEGLKAYRVGQARPSLFRPLDNCRRLAGSARRLSMPEVPEALFMEAIEAVADVMTPFVPGKSGQALYLRPFLFGTESGYLVRNSTTFKFMVIANLVEAYATGPMRVAVERADVRAAVGGLGDVKAAANYAGSLRASSAAVARGYTVALWLDAREHRFIQELSGMNLFAVIDGELHTPALDGAILPGITRDSLIKLAPGLGYKVRERAMPIDELLGQIASGACDEVFATGTAAIVNGVGVLADGDGVEHVPRRIDHVAARFREALLSIQERRAEDQFGWVHEVRPHA
jgi:branched-chain amino acid aminotransferase